MMGNLFLSFLGTNNYQSCVYYQGTPPAPNSRKPVRFVQEATIGKFCQGWGVEDRIIIFTTKDAIRTNWLDDGHERPIDDSAIARQGLQNRLKKMELSVSHQNTLIPDGSSETELWEIFRIVLDSIREEDDVVFDITHAFRSIPMLAIVILNYARIVKRIRIGGIYYGAFETLGNLSDVKRIPISDRLVPILDLTPISNLLEWGIAVDRFVKAGDSTMVSELTKAGVKPILKSTRGKDRTADTMRKIADSLDKFCLVMSTCRGLMIEETARRLQSQLADIAHTDLLPPFKPLFSIIDKNIKGFSGDAVRDGLQAAKWCLDHRLIQQGFTILNEVLVTHVLVRSLGRIETDEKIRRLPGQAAAIIAKKIVEKKECWEKSAKDYSDLTLKVIGYLSRNTAIKEMLTNIRDIRNDINHAGVRENAINEKKFAPTLKAMIETVEAIIV
jgi:CRISPR-associated Csx2 family protein